MQRTLLQPTHRPYRSAGSGMILGSVLALAVGNILIAGCASTTDRASSRQTMMQEVTRRSASQAGGNLTPQMLNQMSAAQGRRAAVAIPSAPAAMPAIATVNGHAITYNIWINLLKRSHGLAAFQYILGVELARQAAQAKGIVLTEDQLEQALKQEIAEVAGSNHDPAQQQRILKAVLARRGITMDEFRLLSRRNAYLRQIVEPIVERSITQDALKAEFGRLYGERVQIRHIQLSDSTAVQRVMQALSDGMDFAQAARMFSQNLDTAANGGRLPPFSSTDPAVPAGLRELAFATAIGKVAGPVRVDGWSHIIKVESRIPAQDVQYAKVATHVRQSLKEQLGAARDAEALAEYAAIGCNPDRRSESKPRVSGCKAATVRTPGQSADNAKMDVYR